MRALRADAFVGRHAARVGKYPGLAARLALICHLIDWAAGRAADPRIVPARTVTGVLDLMDDYVLPMEARVYAAYGVTAEAEGGRRIAKWIRETRPTRFTAREVQRHDWSGLKTPTEVAAALEWLVARSWLREADREARPGRPSNVFLVNPLVGADRG